MILLISDDAADKKMWLLRLIPEFMGETIVDGKSSDIKPEQIEKLSFQYQSRAL